MFTCTDFRGVHANMTLFFSKELTKTCLETVLAKNNYAKKNKICLSKYVDSIVSNKLELFGANFNLDSNLVYMYLYLPNKWLNNRSSAQDNPNLGHSNGVLIIRWITG